MTDILQHITLESGKHPQHSIIWLHGLGADGHDFVPMVDELKLPVAVRYIFPHAPKIPVTVNGGFVMRAWYDIQGATINTQQDEAGIRRSHAAITTLINQEIAHGIAPKNIFLAGFSQGGAIALHTALRLSEPLGGVLALSTYLPLAELAATEMNCNRTPIFMAHGRSDGVVAHDLGVASRDKLLALGYDLVWHSYAMQHSVCAEEIRDMQSWLSDRMTRT
jgi:phospholipase/carboxylesterase